MKNVQELKSALKGVFDEATQALAREASGCAPVDMDAETLAVYEKAMRELETLVRKTLQKDVLYCTPDDDFYPAVVRLMSYPLYAVYTSYEIAPDVTDEQILAHRSAIEHGDLAALEPLRKQPPEKMFEARLAEGDWKRRRMLNNLYYYLYLMAHLAKHYGSREAAQNYLRAASIARKGVNRLPLNLTEDAINELVSLAQDAADELMVAADYYALPEWEGFRDAESNKLAAAEAELRKREAK